MRNKSIIQFTGSKVTHMPHPFNDGTLCGRGNVATPWEGGYYETLPEITCKTCVRTIPQAKWSHLTSPYKYHSDVLCYRDETELFSAETLIKSMGDCTAHWFPSADGDENGILALYGLHSKCWYVYTA